MSGPPSASALQGHEQEIGGGYACILLPAAIAAVVVASQYNEDESVCNDGTQYTMDLQFFLYLVGYMQIGYGALHLCVTCCSQSCSEENKQSLLRLVRAPDCLLLCFYLAMGGIGFYMYDNQMSDACKEEGIAIMIFAWSIVQYALIGLACCCVLCMFCCIGTILAAATKQKNSEMTGIDDSDQDALVSH
eukprot:133460_1